MLVVEKGVESLSIWKEEASYHLLERGPAEASPELEEGMQTNGCLLQSQPQVLGVKVWSTW